jgi:NAD(P)-dependent dehydrogenase (short-subunit alcohol dehydrogenase family)
LLVFAAVQAAWAADEGVETYQPTVLITGANRGIGLAFAREYAARGWHVIGTARQPEEAADLQALVKEHPDKVHVEKLDVRDFAAVDALAAKYAGRPIDVLLHNAGISGGSQTQMLGKMQYDVFEDVLKTNVVAPLKISEAFLKNVEASQQKKIVTVSSSEGSITGATQPRLYFYRSSKAAVNMVMKNLALQLKSRGVTVAMVNPGMTDTDFMKGLPKNLLRPPAEAVRDMMRNIDGLSVANTGSFWEYDGKTIAW